MKKITNCKAFKYIHMALKTLVIVALVGFVIVVSLQRFSDNKISFFNYRMFTVVSGSMKPKYNVGDVLIAKKVDPSTIKVGDAISYLGRGGDFHEKVITHQVVEPIKDPKTGQYSFRSIGLANLIEDPIVHEDQLYGVIKHKSFILSTIYGIVATELGFFLFIIIPLMYIIGSEIIAIMLDKEDKRRNEIK